MTKFSRKKMLFFIILLIVSIFSINKFEISTKAYSKDNIHLIPLGNIVGIKLNTKGVLVIGIDEDYLGKKVKGIKVGDVIVKINDKEVNSSKEIQEILSNLQKESVYITIKRDGNYINKNIKVYKDENLNKYKIGVWVRDKVAGIGTMTFYNPKTNSFGALGHGITDIDTGELIQVKDGSIYLPDDVGIKKGNIGIPGEIVGEFNEGNIVGLFDENSNFGIKGKLTNKEKFKNLKPIEVAHYYEIKKGKASILFPDENGNIKEYEIKIQKIFSQDNPESKSMLIEIVDESLLKYTGGIVQGMSGSPIIQNGKLIGAVTHVFVNDPKKGYAIFIDWMIK